MKQIQENKRRVVNLRDAKFEPFDDEVGTGMLQLNPNVPRATGFYLYRMEPGSSSAQHKHLGAEEFYMIEGELIDNDGTIYRAGDVVWLDAGTEHNSSTNTGCTIAVFSEKGEVPPDETSNEA
ncbi:cupin domain-containing protein [Alphaproteobacteria bacterium]|nr:cupin domain-containing protein [Alphaproteobacteria bacterium]